MKSIKKRVGVLYGGRSGEHRISLRSAASVLSHLDPEKFEAVPIGIDEQGRWHMGNAALLQNKEAVLPIFQDDPEVFLPAYPSEKLGTTLLSAAAGGPQTVDVVFPVVHGPLCEDGTLQGLLELADVPYVGSGVLASAVAMDKDVCKRLVQQAGVPVVPWVLLRKHDWKGSPGRCEQQVAASLGFPCFVKPANLGSSVGTHKVKRPEDLAAALDDAFRYDRKVLVERAIPARELEVAMLEEHDVARAARASVVGEIVPTHDFYSYEAKYIDPAGASFLIPAPLSAVQTDLIRRLAAQVFETLGCEGMARVDFFLDRKTGDVYFNELNSIPGFTSISMYPKLWEASGVDYTSLLTHLIELALLRHKEKQAIERGYAP